MNSKEQTGRAPETGVHPHEENHQDSWCNSDDMKRVAAKKLIERYFYQLIDGCGNPNCSNQYCASSGKIKNLTANEAAAQAFQLFSEEAKLCDAHPSKVARTQPQDTINHLTSNSITANPCSSGNTLMNTQPSHSKNVLNKQKPTVFLNEEKLVEIIDKCQDCGSYSPLIHSIGEVFSNPKSLSISFIRKEPETPLDAMLEKAGEKDLKTLKKEDVRSLAGDLDKDEDCKEHDMGEEIYKTDKKNSRKIPIDDITLDVQSLRRTYKKLFAIDNSIFKGALINAIVGLMNELEVRLKNKTWDLTDDLVNILVIVIELPLFGSSEFFESIVPIMCKVSSYFDIATQAKLARIWARYCSGHLKPLLDSLQQLITLKILTEYDSALEVSIHNEEAITAPTKLMKIIYYANILAGELDSAELREDRSTTTRRSSAFNPFEEAMFGTEENADSSAPGSKTSQTSSSSSNQSNALIDPLELELEVSVLDSRKPIIAFEEFYNELLCDKVEMDKDFTYFKHDTKNGHPNKRFSFMNYSFILSPATKILGLYYDNRIRMYNERRISFLQTAVGQPTNPYLKLKVKRDHVIEDALVELEMIALENPKDFKKQLVVEFEGEQGVDEGGISKEFFQLVTEEIFKPDYGMFFQQSDTETMWFNPTSFENDAQFTLIGIVIGLAIYNNIILDMRFPMVLYKKLMGKRGTYYDLEDFNPTLFQSLRQLLEYTDDDFENIFLLNFKICYTDVFGSLLTHELKENGEEIAVTQENKQEFVTLYADFLLNKCIEKQFRAFRNGFQMVTDESPLNFLFRPEEVEKLVCGSKNFDFKELQFATEYDGGYTAQSEVIVHFWEIVHAMSLEDKQRLLQFATGSDRVPVGGFSRLKLIIARCGPDSDRLPTAHTCFNVLFLPEYSTTEKLQDRLEKAIKYSKGFGIL